MVFKASSLFHVAFYVARDSLATSISGLGNLNTFYVARAAQTQELTHNNLSYLHIEVHRHSLVGSDSNINIIAFSIYWLLLISA